MDEQTNEMTSVDAAEIDSIINAVAPLLNGLPVPHVVIAALTIALLVQDDQISDELLRQGVLQTSHFIGAYLNEYGSNKNLMNLPPSQVN